MRQGRQGRRRQGRRGDYVSVEVTEPSKGRYELKAPDVGRGGARRGQPQEQRQGPGRRSDLPRRRRAQRKGARREGARVPRRLGARRGRSRQDGPGKDRLRRSDPRAGYYILDAASGEEQVKRTFHIRGRAKGPTPVDFERSQGTVITDGGTKIVTDPGARAGQVRPRLLHQRPQGRSAARGQGHDRRSEDQVVVATENRTIPTTTDGSPRLG